MTENRTYTEADLKALRKEWEAEAIQREVVRSIAEIKGQLLQLPATMEAVARRVASEVIADQHKQATDRAWGRAPVLAQTVQLIVAIVAVVAAYVTGRGHIP